MARTTAIQATVQCTVCRHPKMADIDRSLVAGLSAAEVARHHPELNRRAVARHRANHLSEAIQAVVRKDEKRVLRLVDRAEALVDSAEEILTTAKEGGKAQLALSAIREMRESLKLLGQASGELKPDGATTVQVLNVQQSPEWLGIRTAILGALDAYPEAKAAVVAALTGTDAPLALQGPRRAGRADGRAIAVVPYRPEDPADAEEAIDGEWTDV